MVRKSPYTAGSALNPQKTLFLNIAKAENKSQHGALWLVVPQGWLWYLCFLHFAEHKFALRLIHPKPHNSNKNCRKRANDEQPKCPHFEKKHFISSATGSLKGGGHTQVHTHTSSPLAFQCPVKVIDGEFCCLLMHTADKLSLSDCAVWFVRDGARQNELAAHTEEGQWRRRQKLVWKGAFEENYISEGLKAAEVQISRF